MKVYVVKYSLGEGADSRTFWCRQEAVDFVGKYKDLVQFKEIEVHTVGDIVCWKPGEATFEAEFETIKVCDFLPKSQTKSLQEVIDKHNVHNKCVFHVPDSWGTTKVVVGRRS